MIDKEILSAKPKERPYRISDSKGLYLEILPSGSKRWRFRFSFNGRESMIALGQYPKVKLKDARQLRDEQRDLIDQGIHPAELRRKQKAKQSSKHSFRRLSEKFLENLRTKKRTRTAHRDISAMFENHVYPFIGDMPIGQITPGDIRKIIKRMEDSGIRANRVRANISRIMRRAVAEELRDFDPTPPAEILSEFATDPIPNPPQHEVPAILKKLAEFDDRAVTRYALMILPHIFLRPGELRRLRWSWVKLSAREIRIPEGITKTGEPLIVPLSNQVHAMLVDLREITGHRTHVFPNQRRPGEPMSENTANAALNKMGFTGKTLRAHSFRKIASTALHELGFNTQWIERQLCHADRNRIRAVYNDAQFLDGRRQMMQAWSDRIDEIKED